MAYYREIRLDELVVWLSENWADSPAELAEKMYNKFDIITDSNTPS